MTAASNQELGKITITVLIEQLGFQSPKTEFRLQKQFGSLIGKCMQQEKTVFNINKLLQINEMILLLTPS
jgi:hypothetical protein